MQELRNTRESFDVLGLGCTAVDDVLYVASYPVADEKMRVERSVRRCGGLTGAALIAAARLGARCAYAGCLGTDELSQYVAGHFTSEGISMAHTPRLPEACVVHSTIIVGRDTGSRNIFFEIDGLLGSHDSLPAEEVIRAAKVLFIDHYQMPGNLRATRVARAAGVRIVADFERSGMPLFEEVQALVDHLVLSEGFALNLTGAATAPEAALALWRKDREAVIITCGANGCWSVSAEHPNTPRHHSAFAVEVADTTGCGDVFHGAYAARLARGDDLEARIRFASAAAALKATRTEIPRIAEVEQFLTTRGSGETDKRARETRETHEK